MTGVSDQPSSASLPGRDVAATQTLAAGGDSEAQFALGSYYANTVDGSQDFPHAAAWYRKAADQGHALAQYNLGVMFARGQGVARDQQTSANWLRKAAEGGDASGQYDLGVLCYRASINPLTAERNEFRIEAYKWLYLAAVQEYGDSAAACERVNLAMTRDEVIEGNRRATAFVSREPSGLHAT